MDKFLQLLKLLGLEVKDTLKTELDKPEVKAAIEAAFKTPDGLLTQEQVDKAVQDRLKRAEKQHETELTALKTEMTKLVDPAKVTEVETKFKAELEAANKRIEAATKETKLRDQLHKAGVKDIEYLMYQAGQKGTLTRFTVDDKGNVSVVGADGKPAFGKDGKALEISHLVDELKTDFKDQFTPQKTETPGATNPFGADAKLGDVGALMAKRAAESAAVDADPWNPSGK
jgi:Skp family chaperone for outer membrane proteins